MGLREILFPCLSLSVEGQPGRAFECIFFRTAASAGVPQPNL